MERMRVALEKARREREAVQDGQAPPPTKTSERRPMRKGAGSAALVLDIDKAQVVKPSPRELCDSRIVSGPDHREFADIYRILRAQVLLRLAERDQTALGISSALPGEGKTLTAINLAISLSKDVNRSVLLVDVDLRRPTIHRYLGFSPEAGLTDVLTSDVELSDVLVNPGMDRLLVLPNRMSLSDSSEVLSSPKMIELVTQFKNLGPKWFVIYDLPPVLVSDDCISFMYHIGACILVVEEGRSSSTDIARAVDLLGDHKLIGTVLNKASPMNDESSYYYGYSSDSAPRDSDAWR